MQEGLKHDDGKLPLHLIAPELLYAVATVLAFGARKYAPRNWEKGINYSRVFRGVMGHMWSWFTRVKADPETGYSHLWHAACGVMFLLAYEMRGMVEFDDRPEGCAREFSVRAGLPAAGMPIPKHWPGERNEVSDIGGIRVCSVGSPRCGTP